MKNYIFVVFFLAGSIKIYAQYDEHALRYSQSIISGSSRTLGIGGANIALGADISSANLNPAGLGLLHRNEFSITAALAQANTSTSFLGTTSTGAKSFGSVPNFGIVLSNVKDEIQEGKYRGGSFGITYTKTNNFQNSFNYTGTNTSNSIADYFAESALGTDERTMYSLSNDNLSTLYQAAYKSNIIDPIKFIQNGGRDTVNAPGNPYQFAYLPDRRNQSETIATRGGQYAWNFSYGGNYNDKVYFGFGLGITKVNYAIEKFYFEDLFYGSEVKDPGLTNINLYENYSAKGTGFNLKAGVIAKATEQLRFGISFNTPTYYSIRERKDYTFDSKLHSKTYPLTLRGATNDFNLTTPLKVTPGISYFFGKNGFITAEFDYVSYTTSRVGGGDIQSSYKNDNNKISNGYLNTFNYRAGAEYRYDIFRFRAGFNYFGDPYKNKIINRGMTNVTLGAGIRQDNFYIDIAYVNSAFNTLYSPYSLQNTAVYGDAPIASIKNHFNTFNFTFGTFF